MYGMAGCWGLRWLRHWAAGARGATVRPGPRARLADGAYWCAERAARAPRLAGRYPEAGSDTWRRGAPVACAAEPPGPPRVGGARCASGFAGFFTGKKSER